MFGPGLTYYLMKVVAEGVAGLTKPARLSVRAQRRRDDRFAEFRPAGAPCPLAPPTR